MNNEMQEILHQAGDLLTIRWRNGETTTESVHDIAADAPEFLRRFQTSNRAQRANRRHERRGILTPFFYRTVYSSRNITLVPTIFSLLLFSSITFFMGFVICLPCFVYYFLLVYIFSTGTVLFWESKLYISSTIVRSRIHSSIHSSLQHQAYFHSPDTQCQNLLYVWLRPPHGALLHLVYMT